MKLVVNGIEYAIEVIINVENKEVEVIINGGEEAFTMSLEGTLEIEQEVRGYILELESKTEVETHEEYMARKESEQTSKNGKNQIDKFNRRLEKAGK